MNILILLAGLTLILVGANYLTDGSAALAQRFRVPEFVIGLTIVAIGTSTPELVVSVMSAIQGNSDISVGNVVGSNLFNVFVILGVCSLIAPFALSGGNLRRDIPFGVAASLLLLIMVSDRFLHLGITDSISRIDGIIMLLLYAGLIWYTIRSTKRTDVSQGETPVKYKPIWLTIVMIVGGLIGLIFGGDLFLHSATGLARTLGMSESVIAITLVAGGTSLPELASSAVAVIKGKPAMALGNVIGSNIANILLILGVSATIHPLSLGGITTTDILMVVLSSVLLFVAAFSFRRRMLDRWEGAIFLVIYVTYIWFLIK